MRHISTALTRPRVRAGSHRLGTCERGWWHAMTRQDARRIVLAARKYERAEIEIGQARRDIPEDWGV